MTNEPPYGQSPSDDQCLPRALDATESSAPQPTVTQTTPPLPARNLEGPGTLIGRYKLLQQIGEGGFGVVYMAEQRVPVKRRVALKVIKVGMDTKQVIARFEAERQALAMMDHPNIAKVLDAGSTEIGRPFFVMEYIKGVPILEYCDTAKLDTRARLELFSQVCQAIQHAHQKGIIHRDIKPSNVLVTMHDGGPVPKVIDFGIAKATSCELTAKTLFTEHRQMIGTPAYMSPEQAEMSGLDIDTRSDIYSLGVLLYELLTGTTPFALEELMSKGFAEMMRIIREVEPQKPSTRLSSLGETGTRTARQRHAIDPKKLSQNLKGDLDWIVMKCLEKDRTRRYETANGLAADIKRHLNDEPITAGAPSTGYKLRKFAKRNRPQVIAGGIVAAALLIGVIAVAWQARIVRDQRDLAVQARKIAEAQREKAELIADFMSGILAGVNPWVAEGRDTTMLKEMMDRAAARIENGELESAPDAELTLRGTIGNTFTELALYDAARKMLEPAVALARLIHAGDHPATALSLLRLGRLFHESGDQAGAEPLFRESLEMRKRLFPGDHPEVANGLDNLGDLLQYRGDLAGAETLFREELAMWKRLSPGDNMDVAMCLNNLGWVLQGRGNLAEAEPLYRESLSMWRRLGSGDDRRVSDVLNSLAVLLQARGDLAEAEPVFRESLAMYKRLSSEEYPKVAMALNDLASLLAARGDLAGAEPLYREALEMRRRLVGKEHPDTVAAVISMGGLRVAQGNYIEALKILAPTEGEARKAFSGGHAWQLGRLLMHLGKARAGLAKTGAEFAAAEANQLEAYANFVKAPGLFPQDTRDSVQALVDFYVAWDKAEPGKGHDAKAAEWRAKLPKEKSKDRQ